MPMILSRGRAWWRANGPAGQRICPEADSRRGSKSLGASPPLPNNRPARRCNEGRVFMQKQCQPPPSIASAQHL